MHYWAVLASRASQTVLMHSELVLSSTELPPASGWVAGAQPLQWVYDKADLLPVQVAEATEGCPPLNNASQARVRWELQLNAAALDGATFGDHAQVFLDTLHTFLDRRHERLNTAGPPLARAALRVIDGSSDSAAPGVVRVSVELVPDVPLGGTLQSWSCTTDGFQSDAFAATLAAQTPFTGVSSVELVSSSSDLPACAQTSSSSGFPWETVVAIIGALVG